MKLYHATMCCSVWLGHLLGQQSHTSQNTSQVAVNTVIP